MTATTSSTTSKERIDKGINKGINGYFSFTFFLFLEHQSQERRDEEERGGNGRRSSETSHRGRDGGRCGGLSKGWKHRTVLLVQLFKAELLHREFHVVNLVKLLLPARRGMVSIRSRALSNLAHGVKAL